MRIAILFATLALSAFAGEASAACYGSDSFKTCTDSNGNSYNVSRYGNTTVTQGYNAETGSSWNQTDQTIGNSVYTNGQSNGDSWNMQRQYYGDGNSSYSGTNKDGENFSGTCTKYGGCY